MQCICWLMIALLWTTESAGYMNLLSKFHESAAKCHTTSLLQATRQRQTDAFAKFLDGRAVRWSKRPYYGQNNRKPQRFVSESKRHRPDSQPVPGVKEIIRASKRTDMAAAGITMADIDRILRTPKLTNTNRNKLLVAKDKMRSFVPRITYGRRLLYDRFREGMKVRGRVISIRSSGAFIDIGAMNDAFCPLGDMIPNVFLDGPPPQSFLKPGQDIDVFVKKIDHQSEGVIVSLYESTNHALATQHRLSVGEFNISQPMQGIIIKTHENAAFVDIGAIVDAYLPLKFCKQHYEYPDLTMSDLFEPGMNMTVWVATVDTSTNRIQVCTEPEKLGWMYWKQFLEQQQQAEEEKEREAMMEEDGVLGDNIPLFKGIDPDTIPWVRATRTTPDTTVQEWYAGSERIVIDDLAEQ